MLFYNINLKKYLNRFNIFNVYINKKYVAILESIIYHRRVSARISSNYNENTCYVKSRI